MPAPIAALDATRRTTAAHLVQAAAGVVMIRPHAFAPNPQTAADNAFQRPDDADGPAARAEQAARARDEVDEAARRLRDEGVRVHLFDDPGADTPDSVFPNNWFSTHAGGHVALFPMALPSRRRERRADVIELLKREYRVQDVIDYSGLEHDGLFLEGTGAMVLDHLARVAYVARSRRADPIALERFCTHFNFEPIVFDTADARGRAVYHTNVLMAVGTGFALAGFDLFANPRQAADVRARLAEAGREVIALDARQVTEFAANALELRGRDGPLLALSARGLAALAPGQVAALERHVRLVALPVPTIERAGGSVRCMLAGIHLAPR